MGVIRVVPKLGSRVGPEMDAKGTRKYRETYIVTTNDPRTAEVYIVNAFGLPSIDSAHPRDPGAICERIAPRQDKEQPCVWEIEVEWSSKSIDPNQKKKPTERPPLIKTSFVPKPKSKGKDLDGKAYVNTAGTPYDPAPESLDQLLRLTISCYQKTFDAGTAKAYIKATNSDAFLCADPCHAVMVDCSSEQVYEEGEYAWHVTAVIDVGDDDMEFEEILDAGPEYIDDNDKKTVYKDDYGIHHITQVLLDGQGKKLAKDAEPHFNKFRVRNKKPFRDVIKL